MGALGEWAGGEGTGGQGRGMHFMLRTIAAEPSARKVEQKKVDRGVGRCWCDDSRHA